MKILHTLCCILMLFTCVCAQPVDNPYKTFYNIQGYHWTDSIVWDRVLNINDFTGATMVDKFNKARDSAAALGGAVVFFPAGVYHFEGSINLRSGVVIRGENPIFNNAKNDNFAPPTIFEFPAYVPSFEGAGTPNSTAFMGIGCLAHTSRAGIVNIDLNNARINVASVTFVTVSTPRGNTSRSVENNRNLLVMGVRSNNVAAPYNTVPAAGQHQWQRFSSPFASNIRVYAAANAAIVNCRINDFTNNTIRPVVDLSYDQPGYLAQKSDNTFDTVAEPWHARFDYSAHHGISMNRKATITNATPDEEPGSFSPGLEIKDNWVYHTMRVGIICSGMGIVIKGNVVRDKPGKAVYLHPHGVRFATNNAATYENRGIDFGGWDVVIEDNDIEVFRHRINNGPYFSVDGEGILTQECCGGTAVNGALIRKNKVNAFIGLWKMRDIMNVVIDSNNLQNNPIIMTANRGGAGNNYTFHRLYNNAITNNYNVSSINTDGNLGGTNVLIANNQIINNGRITAPCFSTVQNNPGFSEIRYTAIADSTWGQLIISNTLCTNHADNFPALKFAKPLSDTTVQQNTTSLNLKANILAGQFDSLVFYQGFNKIATTLPQSPVFEHNISWNQVIPFLPIQYRIQGFLDSARIRIWSNTVNVTFEKEILTANQSRKFDVKIQVYPNPASKYLYIQSPQPLSDNQIGLYDMHGRKMSTKLESDKLNMTQLAKGIYILRITSSQGIDIIRVIKE